MRVEWVGNLGGNRDAVRIRGGWEQAKRAHSTGQWFLRERLRFLNSERRSSSPTRPRDQQSRISETVSTLGPQGRRQRAMQIGHFVLKQRRRIVVSGTA